MQENKVRMTYIDVVKAIAMISVVLFHACTNHENTYLATNAYFIRFTSAYAIPVFFFVNGFLYRNKDINSPIKSILKKIKSYYLPFLWYNLFYLCAHNIFVTLHMVDEKYGNGYYDATEYIKHFFKAITGHREYFSGALWFLGSILTVNAIIIIAEYCIHKFSMEKYYFLLLGLVAIICLIAGNVGVVTDRMKIETSLANVVYFYLGMLFKHFDWNNIFIKNKKVYIILGILIDLIVSCNKQYNPFGITNSLIYIVLDYLNAFLCIIAIMMIAQVKWIEKSKILRIVGQNTLDIMALHFMFFKIVSLLVILVYKLPITRLAEYPVLIGIDGAWWLLYALVGIVFSTLFSVFRHKLFQGKKER